MKLVARATGVIIIEEVPVSAIFETAAVLVSVAVTLMLSVPFTPYV